VHLGAFDSSVGYVLSPVRQVFSAARRTNPSSGRPSRARD
jgi:hypothetical protein